MNRRQTDQLRLALEKRREVLIEDLNRDAARRRELGITDAMADAAEAAHALRDLAELRDIECQRRHEKSQAAAAGR